MANIKELEDELVEWILVNCLLSIAVTSWEVIIKDCSLDESLELKISIHSKTGATDFWIETCWLSVQVLMLTRNY